MCGIAGVLLYPAKRSLEEWEELKDIFTRNLIFNEERGKDASGIALIRSDGSHELFKAPLSASELVETEEYKEILNQVSEDTVCVLGHTRFPTKGDPSNNDNNHPLVAGYVMGVHNGIIINDDDLFAEYKFPRRGEVDSEIVFHLLGTISPFESDGNYLKHIHDKATLLGGSFAIIAVDLRSPKGLIVLKNSMPLCLHYHEPWRALLFSSRYLFLRKAFGKSVITEALSSPMVFYFNADKIVERGSEAIYSLSL